MRDDSIESCGLPFDNLFLSGDSLVARQTKGSPNFLAQTLSWRYFRNCTSEVVVPVNSSPAGMELFQFLLGYQQQQPFTNLCAETGARSGQVIDLSVMYIMFVSIMRRAKKLLELDGVSFPIFFKAQLTGIWRKIPFLDTEEFISFAREFGLPVIQQKKAIAPEGLDPETCLPLSDDPEMPAHFVHAAFALLEIGAALGLPNRAFGFAPDADHVTWMTSCQMMGQRSLEVSRRRAQSGQR